MIKPFVSFGMFWSLSSWEFLHKLRCDFPGVHHFIFCCTRMDAVSVKSYLRLGSVKTFILQFTEGAAVYRIGKISLKLLYIKFMRAAANFLIGGECYTDFSMFYFRMLNQIMHCCHNLSNSGFIIGTKQSCPVRRN